MFQPRTGTSTELISVAIFNLILYPLRPTCYKICLDIYFYPPPWTYFLPPPYMSLFDTYSLYMLHPLITTNSNGRGATVHLDVAPTHRPPPLVSTLPSIDGRPLEFCATCL